MKSTFFSATSRFKSSKTQQVSIFTDDYVLYGRTNILLAALKKLDVIYGESLSLFQWNPRGAQSFRKLFEAHE